MEGIVSINGKVLKQHEAQISVFDRGFLFGDFVFEVLVAFSNKILDINQHLRRLRRSAAQVQIHIPWPDDVMADAMQDLVTKLGCAKTYLRLVVTRGEGATLKPSKHLKANLLIYALPANMEHKEVYEKGFALTCAELGFTLRGAAAKTGNYLRSIAAVKEAEAKGFNDILWVNSDGEITESSTANVFLVGRIGDLVEIATPPAESGLLLGITRENIIELLTRSQIPVTQRVVCWEELPRFDEAFLCSTVRGLVPVHRIDGHTLHTTRSNAVYRHIERLYLTWVESQLGYRVNWNTGFQEQVLQ